MQNPESTEKPPKNTSSKSQVVEKATNLTNKEPSFEVSKPKDFYSVSNNDVTAHRRKQSKPVSLNSLPETSLNSRQSPDGASPQVTSSSNNVTQLDRKDTNSKNVDTPLSLVRSKEASTSNSEDTKSLEKNKIGNTVTNSIAPANEKHKNTSTNNEKFNEKDVLLAVQALAGLSGQPDTATSVEGINLLLSAYSDALKGSENVDINKMNEILTATVAAEMKRLQMHQVNLTKEIETLSKNDRNSSSASRKQVNRN